MNIFFDRSASSRVFWIISAVALTIAIANAYVFARIDDILLINEERIYAFFIFEMAVLASIFFGFWHWSNAAYGFLFGGKYIEISGGKILVGHIFSRSVLCRDIISVDMAPSQTKLYSYRIELETKAREKITFPADFADISALELRDWIRSALSD